MVEFSLVKEILDTLPIGLYAHRRIATTLVQGEETSYYSPQTDTITISYDIIAEGMKKAVLTEDYTEETAVRSMLYHEVSHAILTPSMLGRYWQNNVELPFSIMNIFEDERIETLLKDFYLDTNFKKQLLYINGGIHKARNAEEEFYNVVRFRLGKAKFVERVAEIISKYTNFQTNSRSGLFDYVHEVAQLYEDIAKSFGNNSNNGNADNSNMESASNDIENSKSSNGQELSNTDTTTSKRGAIENANEEKSSGAENGQGKNASSINEKALEKMLEELEKRMEKAEDKMSNGRGKSTPPMENFINGIFNKFVDNSLTATLNTIICQFNKKNKGGSGVNAYSGVLNPKAFITRDDYRIFERALSSNGNNKFGTCHLNLFIDCSGSFSNNEDKVNTLLKSLIEIEKKNKNFTFDTIFCGDGLHEVDKKHRWLKADEGTWASYNEVKEMMKKHNLKNTMNYNIVLYDGQCGYRGKNPFLAWDTNNTTLIIEKGNANNVRPLKNAKIININDYNYSERLTEEIIKVLTVAFH